MDLYIKSIFFGHFPKMRDALFINPLVNVQLVSTLYGII